MQTLKFVSILATAIHEDPYASSSLPTQLHYQPSMSGGLNGIMVQPMVPLSEQQAMLPTPENKPEVVNQAPPRPTSSARSDRSNSITDPKVSFTRSKKSTLLREKNWKRAKKPRLNSARSWYLSPNMVAGQLPWEWQSGRDGGDHQARD